MMDHRAGPRLFIFGWDAADWAVIEAGWREGRIEHLRAIADRGQSGTAMSTIPPITPPAFTSFLTGTDPGEHGIFGFVTRGQGYEYLPVPGGARRVPTLIRRLDRAGYRTALVTFPYTYPAEPLEHGVVVPGWDDPEETFDSVHPPEAGRDLARVVPKVPRLMNILAPDDVVFERITEHLDLRERIARWAIDRADPHVFATVFSETDHAAHRWWGEGDPPRELIDVYDMVDRSMGRLMADFIHEDDTVLVASDHGSWPVHHLVHLAPLLADAGLLRSGRTASAAPLPRGIDRPRRRSRLNAQDGGRQRRLISKLDWPNTLAFPFGDQVVITGVSVNRPPLPLPAVAQDEYEDVRNEVASVLTKVEDPDGEGLAFSTVARREEVYRGPAVDLAPDMVVDGAPGCSPHMGRLLKSTQVFTEVRIGGHRPEGMFAISSDLGLADVEPIRDVMAKVLRALSYVLPEDLGVPTSSVEGYSSQEAQEMEARLRGLGYME